MSIPTGRREGIVDSVPRARDRLRTRKGVFPFRLRVVSSILARGGRGLVSKPKRHSENDRTPDYGTPLFAIVVARRRSP